MTRTAPRKPAVENKNVKTPPSQDQRLPVHLRDQLRIFKRNVTVFLQFLLCKLKVSSLLCYALRIIFDDFLSIHNLSDVLTFKKLMNSCQPIICTFDLMIM